MLNLLKNLVLEEEGQGMVEYALIIALVAVILIGALTAMQGGIKGTFNSITNSLGGTPAL